MHSTVQNSEISYGRKDELVKANNWQSESRMWKYVHIQTVRWLTVTIRHWEPPVYENNIPRKSNDECRVSDTDTVSSMTE
jgi:hypothetical protein